ncbi:MAG: DUF547 domain-containing protein [Chitinophagales bacterium]
MKKLSFILITSLSTFLIAGNNFSTPDTNENEIAVPVAPSLDDFFNYANTFLGKYISDGKVDYTAINSETTTLNQLVENIASADLSASDKNTSTAFYLNAYNILVIKSVVDNMPISSPLDVKGFFDTKKYKVAGSYMTLNDIENNKLRPDARVHFSLVCAAKGCPKISSEAFMPKKVQDQLNTQTKKAMNNTSFIKVDDSAKTVKISHIFEWYKEDFTKDSGTVIDFINKYRDTKIPSSYTQDYYEYNWSLNSK